MGTRSLTHVLNKERKTILTMYKQHDGCPNGMGSELLQFLKSSILVNGIPLGKKLPEGSFLSNGMECLSAQLVSHFKKGAGGIYLYPPCEINSSDYGQEYEYVIELSDEPTHFYSMAIYEDSTKLVKGNLLKVEKFIKERE